MKIICIVILFLCSCASHRKGVVTKTPNGVIFDMGADGVLSYKDKDIEAKMDTKKKSGIVEDIIKLYTIQRINRNN